ncbi:CHAT domain-containing protein [Microcoleus sp. ARI1-B5]|uniref:CHAT domain-containing protein n=1 Tax=unclassified Microcoleus TaxID=2642155 RepID=UPI002FD11EB9
MNSDRQQAYLNLINQLLTCKSDEEAEVLKSHPDLLDGGLVAAMLEEADNLREFGELDNANRLKNWTGILRKVDSEFLAVIALKAEADRLKTQGNQQSQISQYREALQSYEQALTIYREIGDRQGEANSLHNFGNAYNSLGEYDRAIDFHSQSLVIRREIGDRKAETYSLLALANAYNSLEQYERAIDCHEKSLVIKREIGDRKAETYSLLGLANAYRSLGQSHRVIDFYEQSLVIVREIGDRVLEAAFLCNLGTTYNFLDQYDQAIDCHEQSLVISQEIGDREREASVLCHLGLVYDFLEQYKEAIDFYEQSLVISREIGDRSGETFPLNNLGIAYRSLGQYDRAIDFYEQSLLISREIGDRCGETFPLNNLGIAYRSLGQYDRAIDCHEQSLVISREIGNRQGESISLNNLGETLFKINQFPEAEAKLRDSIQISETRRSELVKDDHKVSFFETQISAYRLLQQVLVAQAKFDEALEISEMSRTRAFTELLQQNLLTTDLANNEITNTLSIPRIQQIAQQKNSTIVEYSIVKPDIYIWVIQPNGNITHRAANLEPLNQQNQSLKQIILKARVSIGTTETDGEGNKIQLESEYKRDETGRFPLLQLLHQILIEPIADLLPADVNSPIIFIPHYDLFLVPFAALQSIDNRYLIEDYTILTSPSIQVLELTREHHNRVRGLREAALIVGDPTIHPNYQKHPYKLRQIPRAKEAAEAIAAILRTQAISGENAAKAIILDQMLNTRIVHLSAHGLLDDFGGSGIPGAIILAPSGDTDDGAIHAADILQLKLNSELVVLSACSTGRGKITGDGVIGLSRCLILAGVPSIIVSLWNMGVISAKLLMTEFYQNLARGENKAAALRRAMLTTKERFPSPIAWAAFTLSGETESLSLETQQVDLRRLKMSLADNYTPREIVAGLTKLLQISEPKLFVNDLPALDVQPTDNVNIIAEKIKAWCETRGSIEENLENEIEQAGAGGTDGDAPDEIVSEFMEVLGENLIRLNLSQPSSLSVETEDNSGTESVDNPT